MLNVKDYQQYIEKGITALSLDKEPHDLYYPIRYALEQGGKRIRPVLVLAVCEALGGDVSDGMPAALAIEIFHNFTLLHDDIMDRSDLRRGRPTVYKKWSEAVAILSGDAMLTFGMQQLLQSPSVNIRKMVDAFNSSAMSVYEGQQRDMDFEDRNDVTVDDYYRMITGKTAALIEGACRLGALSSDSADDNIVDAFGQYGLQLGLAFQLRDDYLDTFGDSLTFGKPIGGDILNEKKTWLWIEAMSKVPRQMHRAIEEAATPDEKIENVRRVYLESGIAQQLCRLVESHTHQAITALDSVDLSAEARGFFAHIASSLVGRTK